MSILCKFRVGYDHGSLATSIASGVSHEVLYVYLTRETPTGEVAWFFVLHVVCTVVEVLVKKKTFVGRLRAELRERTEHYNQLWLGCQRQLQHELGNVKQGGGTVPPRLSTNNQIKAVPASSEMPKQNHVHLSQGVYSLVSSDAKSEHQVRLPMDKGIWMFKLVNSDQQHHHPLWWNLAMDPIRQRITFKTILHSSEVNGQVSPGEPNGIGSITLVSFGKTERNLESALLDERSLLACIVRTIPAGGRIRISSTLPNRLGKMLAPLHWHDYRKKYGKLEDFVASHLELFMIEDDYIQVREGAQKMVAGSASAAAGKVAVSSSPSSMYVAMTPMAQSQGLKKNVQRGRQSSDYMAPQQRKL
ncbi:unnamed protein product [Brassica napus]|uniref:(rape) hypothetical protein n=1 Tax=Brassica napus TaxID=3708 RepID=A0A816VLU1_BRANA|nr:unnamed protein product [Brassica napus]